MGPNRLRLGRRRQNFVWRKPLLCFNSSRCQKFSSKWLNFKESSGLGSVKRISLTATARELIIGLARKFAKGRAVVRDQA